MSVMQEFEDKKESLGFYTPYKKCCENCKSYEKINYLYCHAKDCYMIKWKKWDTETDFCSRYEQRIER